MILTAQGGAVNTRRFIRLGLCLLVASFATGCELLRGFRSNSSLPSDPNQLVVGPGGPSSGSDPNSTNPLPGTVVSAGGVSALRDAPAGQQGPQNLPGNGMLPPMQTPTPPSLTQPRQLPDTQGGAQGTQGSPPGRPGIGMPGAPGPYGGPTSMPFGDPHQRLNPTVSGDRLNLAPWEVPADRVVSLTKQLDALISQNTALVARIKELESLGISREQALLEAMREVETITKAAARERTDLQSQIAGLQGKIKQLEEEDVIFLRAVIKALDKLLPPEKK